MESLAEALTAANSLHGAPKALSAGSLRRRIAHHQTRVSRHGIGGQGLLLRRYFLEMLTSSWSAMIRRVSAQGGVIINHDSIRGGLPSDDNIDTADHASVVVEKVDIRLSKTPGDKDRAFIGPQDQVDNVRIGYRDFSKRTLAMNRCREPLGQDDRLLRRALDRERQQLFGQAFRRREKKKHKK
jgi:hypothetical protein